MVTKTRGWVWPLIAFVALAWVAIGFWIRELFTTHYVCHDGVSSGRCTCTAVDKRPSTESSCRSTYDCCAVLEEGMTFIVDTHGSDEPDRCVCVRVEPGQTCNGQLSQFNRGQSLPGNARRDQCPP